MPPPLQRLSTNYPSTMPFPARDAELVQIIDASLAEAARRAGSLLACRIGCTQCCHGAFAINALDVLRLRAGMSALRTAGPALAAAVERRAQAWLAEHRSVSPATPRPVLSAHPPPIRPALKTSPMMRLVPRSIPPLAAATSTPGVL